MCTYFHQMQHGIREEDQIHTCSSHHFIKLSQEHVQSLSELIQVVYRLIDFWQLHICIFSLLSSWLWGIPKQFIWSYIKIYKFKKAINRKYISKYLTPHSSLSWSVNSTSLLGLLVLSYIFLTQYLALVMYMTYVLI